MSLPSVAPSAAPSAAPGAVAHVAVTAATLWTAPRSHRPGIDDPALSAPVDLGAWNANTPTPESRGWLLSHLESQALLGAEVVVDAVDGDWAQIVVHGQPTPRDPRGYPGWVPTRHLVVDPDFAQRAATAPVATVTALTSRLHPGAVGRNPGLWISFDTALPVTGRDGDEVEVAVPGALPARLLAADVVVREPGEAPPPATAREVLATAERFLGLRYLWAGMSAYGFDCSGFTHTMLRHHGITIARDAGAQLHDSGLPPVAREDLQPGDLLFFADEPGGERIRHVGFHHGPDTLLHSPNYERSVELISLSGYDVRGEYAGARRPPYAV